MPVIPSGGAQVAAARALLSAPCTCPAATPAAPTCVLVTSCTVVMQPCRMPSCSWMTFTTGACACRVGGRWSHSCAENMKARGTADGQRRRHGERTARMGLCWEQSGGTGGCRLCTAPHQAVGGAGGGGDDVVVGRVIELLQLKAMGAARPARHARVGALCHAASANWQAARQPLVRSQVERPGTLGTCLQPTQGPGSAWTT